MFLVWCGPVITFGLVNHIICTPLALVQPLYSWHVKMSRGNSIFPINFGRRVLYVGFLPRTYRKKNLLLPTNTICMCYTSIFVRILLLLQSFFNLLVCVFCVLWALGLIIARLISGLVDTILFNWAHACVIKTMFHHWAYVSNSF